MNPEPRRLGRKLPVVLVLAGLGFAATQATANPCTGKDWVDAPVVELAPAAAARREQSSLAGIGATSQDKNTPASPPANGIGGTGHGRDEPSFSVAGGIGGTGHSGAGETPPVANGIGGTGYTWESPAPALANGIGGTGHSRDTGGATGFVGVIAGFASICVNGAEIHFDASTSVTIDGVVNPGSFLALGQVVAVTAVSRGDLLYAQGISVLHAVVGPVQRIDAATGQLEILGQTLRLGGGADALRDIRVGDNLVVDGHRLPGGDIRVTRLEKAAAGQQPSINATTTAVEGSSLRINGLVIRLPDALAARPQTGQDVLVTGSLVNGVLHAERLLVNPLAAFATPLRRLDTQGYVRAVDAGGILNVDGARIGIDRNTQILESAGPIVAGSRIHVFASVNTDGRAIAERIRVERPPELDRGAPGVSRRRVDGQSEGGEERQARGDGTVERLSGDGHGSGREDRPAANTDSRNRIDNALPSVERPNAGLPETARPEVTRPDVARPQIERPERGASGRN